MKWTEAQQSVIDAPPIASGLDSQTILVAAAAGSGKTAVLVERIISRLKNLDKPLSVTDLLVVTFTKAAAAEMSARIARKLNEAIQEAYDRKDSALAEHLEEQLRLLPSAHISTLHSFCTWLIRSYFYRIDMDPSFRVGNEGELRLLELDVLDRVLQKTYEDGSCHIYELADMFSDMQSDRTIQELVLQLYTFSMGLSHPVGWLTSIKDTYRRNSKLPLEETIWGQQILSDVVEMVDRVEARYKEIRSLLVEEEAWKKFDALEGAIIDMIHQAHTCTTWSDYRDMISRLQSMKFERFPTSSLKPLVDVGILEKVKALRDQNKKDLQRVGQLGILVSDEEWAHQMALQWPIVEGLVDITLAFYQAFREAKKNKGLLDFTDLEHKALQLLVATGTEDNPQPSEVALELQGQFKEVMVDEYQDTSSVQEAIVNLVSKKDNRFYVGDVKQSIYRFRMADPSLFMGKYTSFSRHTDAIERRIDLSRNFRSHDNILAVTNFIFRQIMTEAGAELDYGDDEALYAGRTVNDPPDSWCGGDVEIHLIECESESTSSDEDDENSTQELDNFEKEVSFIIEKIKELKANGTTVEEGDGHFRPLMWKDIVILLRSTSYVATRMVEMFRLASIPAYADEKSGYFDSLEVKLIVSILQIIDNPEQDLPLAAVLHSGVVGLDANELGRLRMSGTGSLWSLLPDFANEMQHEGLLQFVDYMHTWRTYSRHHSISDLLWHIYETLDYVNYVSAMPNGLLRRANVLALYQRAKEYEAGSFRGIFRFLRFIENLQAANQDLGMAKTVSEADDVVRIMTIHKSKGLEFPVVFVSNLQKRFNVKDLQSPMLMHKEAGLGMKGYYSEYRIMYQSIPWMYCHEKLLRAAKAEEERLLYVAMTRARDKLYLTSFVKSVKKYCEKDMVQSALMATTPALPDDVIRQSNSYLDWILMSVARHWAGGNRIRVEAQAQEVGRLDLPDKECHISLTIHDGKEYGQLDTSSDKQEDLIKGVSRLDSVSSERLDASLVERFNFVYPQQVATKTAAKLSVSEMKRRFLEQEEKLETLLLPNIGMDTSQKEMCHSFGEKNPIAPCHSKEGAHENSLDTSALAPMDTESIHKDMYPIDKHIAMDDVFSHAPALLDTRVTQASGASWGTLMHEAMQWLPVAPYTLDSIHGALDELQHKGYFTDKERQLISDQAISRFFTSPLGQRLVQAKRIEKEWPFSLLVDGTTIYPQLESGEQIFLQGVIDTAFLEDDGWVLIDYKTDRVQNAQDLIARYGIQVSIYKKALAQLTSYPVKETYLYSLRLHEAILVTCDK